MLDLNSRYVLVNGTFSCENDKGLNGYLKTEMGFQGCKCIHDMCSCNFLIDDAW